MMHFQPRMMGHMDENTKKRLHGNDSVKLLFSFLWNLILQDTLV